MVITDNFIKIVFERTWNMLTNRDGGRSVSNKDVGCMCLTSIFFNQQAKVHSFTFSKGFMLNIYASK